MTLKNEQTQNNLETGSIRENWINSYFFIPLVNLTTKTRFRICRSSFVALFAHFSILEKNQKAYTKKSNVI